jgi:excisionase family DNA binding protein
MKKERATLTVDEAAAVLGISRKAAYEGVHAGRIPALRVSSKRIVVPRDALDKLLRSASVAPKACAVAPGGRASTKRGLRK